MSSIIKGYNYDIFISYRQKDNKHDGWVTDFVNNLKGELESTFKEEISVYFDINPHDGLLETHDVDASLKEKLKCLVFIPIISRTYCDPKSFAWEHEFKAFVEQASQDHFGLKVKLPGGNVANRVLPVRIHDLDNDDIKLCESVIGGVLRGVEFIYKEPGVNRSLTSKDDERKNLNGTIYRNQINKVALAIKEIILGLKTAPVAVEKEKTQYVEPSEEVKKEEVIEDQKKRGKLTGIKLLLSISVTLILVVAVILSFPGIFERGTFRELRSQDGRISVAVMPFQNLTNDTTWDIWQSGIQNELITSLTNSEELKVRQLDNINTFLQSKGLLNNASIAPSIAGSVSQKLDASVFIHGSINQAGATIRLNAQLINSKTKNVYKSFQIDGTEENILKITDSLSVQLKNFLILSKLKKDFSINEHYLTSTNMPEAYRYFLYGQKAFNEGDFPAARNMYSQAIAIDSNFYFAKVMLSVSYYNQGVFDQAKKWCLNVYENRDKLSLGQKIHTNWFYAMLFETPYEEIKYLNQLLEIDDQSPGIYYELGRIYVALDQYDKAIQVMKNALEIYKKRDSKPRWANDYIMLGYAYQKTAMYKKEKILYKKAEQDFPDNYSIIQRQAILSLTERDTIAANQYIEKFISLLKDNSVSEADITSSLAYLYTEGGFLDKAEECYRKGLAMEPEHPSLLNNLAWFLILNDRNINEGMELIDKALKIRPNSYLYLENKGLGLYKQGKYEEALEILEKSWKLRPVYDHSSFLFLEKVRKANANQKNN